MSSYHLSEHIRPTSVSYGFGMEDYWVWCGSAIRGEDGLYHMFSARWPKKYPFFTGYVVGSEIVHAVSEKPEGPYTFREVVLGDRGEEYWDGRMTHNPSIVKCGGTYVLFYIGATYKGPRPTPEELCGPERNPVVDECYSTIRIGAATSKSLNGPWERRDEPVFVADPNGWDCTVVTNPAPCVCADGSILMYYRANTPGRLCIGVARSKDASMKFERILDHHIFVDHPEINVEDPFVWQNGDHFEMIAKDLNGKSCGTLFGGVHLTSRDGLSWDYAEDPCAYTRTVKFLDGTESEAYHLERPNLTIENGRPILMSCAYGTAYSEKDRAPQPYGGKFALMEMSKTLIIPLE